MELLENLVNECVDVGRCNVCYSLRIYNVWILLGKAGFSELMANVEKYVNITDGVCSPECSIKGYGMSTEEAKEFFQN